MSKKVEKTNEKKEVKKLKKDYSKIYEQTTPYKLEEAIAIVKKLSKTKFDPSVEVHVRLGINPKKGDQLVRGAVTLPHGTGKTVRVAAFVAPENEAACKAAGAEFVGGDELIAEIKKTGKTEFEVAVAEPLMMRNLAVIAKILGTRGLMPSPKNDTVTPNPAKAVEELKKGKVSFKNDDTSNLHAVIGKLSFDDKKLSENYQAFIEAVRKMKPAAAKGTYIKGIAICASMTPSVKVISS
ncbi:50S ribosomal protein L1 [Patescibacteria group bacterium]|nr:50S ribosomal protein L1 [Patescibacteria group bacterium]